MTPTPLAPILIYDGDCAFCSSTIRLIKQLMPQHPPMEPFQFLRTEDYGLTRQKCGEEIKYVNANGQVYGGEAAFKNFFRDAGKAWKLIALIMSVPVVQQVSGLVYRWVARNRHKLPGGTPTCSLPREY